MADDRINIKTLSQLVGVAPSTVSRILSGKARQYRIAAETEARVLEKVRELGFRPNYFAHSLNTGRTFNLGLVMANSVDTFLGSIIEGVESRLRATEYQMVLATCENNPELERTELQRMLYRQVDGIIIYPSAQADRQQMQQDCLREVTARGIPLVVIGREAEVEVDKVLFSDYEAGAAAARSFIAAGCRCFGSVNLPIRCSANHDRILGYVETLRGQGIAPELIVSACIDPKGDFASQAGGLLSVDCLWGVNTSLVLNSTHALSRLRDVSGLRLCGLGDEPFAELLPFDIAIQPMPSRRMGEMAADFLLEQIERGGVTPARTIHLPWPNKA